MFLAFSPLSQSFALPEVHCGRAYGRHQVCGTGIHSSCPAILSRWALLEQVSFRQKLPLLQCPGPGFKFKFNNPGASVVPDLLGRSLWSEVLDAWAHTTGWRSRDLSSAYGPRWAVI